MSNHESHKDSFNNKAHTLAWVTTHENCIPGALCRTSPSADRQGLSRNCPLLLEAWEGLCVSYNLQEFSEASKFPWASFLPPREKASILRQPQSSVAGSIALMGSRGSILWGIRMSGRLRVLKTISLTGCVFFYHRGTSLGYLLYSPHGSVFLYVKPLVFRSEHVTMFPFSHGIFSPLD